VAYHDLEVRSSEIVQCRAVYPSARPDLQIRIRHCQIQNFETSRLALS